MKEYYKPTCELILKYKDHREPLIRRTVITLIPAMGTYDQTVFEEVFLHRSMAHLQGQLSKPGERDAGKSLVSPSDRASNPFLTVKHSSAFLAIGHLAVNLGSEMKPFIEEIMKNVKDALRQRGSVIDARVQTPSSVEADFTAGPFAARRIRLTRNPSSNALRCWQQLSVPASQDICTKCWISCSNGD